MNRRTFFKRITQGAVATAVLAATPAWVIDAAPSLAQPWACARLSKAYFDFVRRTGKLPQMFVVGDDLFRAFEGELKPAMRWVSREDAEQGYVSLAFRTTRVRSTYERGYGIQVS